MESVNQTTCCKKKHNLSVCIWDHPNLEIFFMFTAHRYLTFISTYCYIYFLFGFFRKCGANVFLLHANYTDDNNDYKSHIWQEN